MKATVTTAAQWWHDFYSQFNQVLPSLVVAVGIVLVSLLVAHVVAVGIRRRASKDQQNQMVYKLIAKLARVGVISLGVISALGTVGISVSALVASLGLMSFAVGFALKDTLTSILSGIMLLMQRPFNVNDHVSVKGVEGEVTEINFRFTILHNGETRILVPNSIMLKEAVTITPHRT